MVIAAIIAQTRRAKSERTETDLQRRLDEETMRADGLERQARIAKLLTLEDAGTITAIEDVLEEDDRSFLNHTHSWRHAERGGLICGECGVGTDKTESVPCTSERELVDLHRRQREVEAATAEFHRRYEMQVKEVGEKARPRTRGGARA